MNRSIRQLKVPSVALLLLALCGCTMIDENGVRHDLVIGFGYIKSKEQDGVSVTTSTILGAQAGPDGITAGFGHKHRVAIDPLKADGLLLEVQSTWTQLEVSAQSAGSEDSTPSASKEPVP